MGYTNIKRMSSTPRSAGSSGKMHAYIMKKGKGEHASTKQEAGGKFPGHRSDWIMSNQNRKGGNWPTKY